MPKRRDFSLMQEQPTREHSLKRYGPNVAVLPNAKHERFAQELAKGKSATEAYALAGYKPSQPNASRLISNDMVQARVAELTGKGAERAEIDIARTLKELVRLGTSDIRNAFTEAGQLKDPHSWSDDFAASVASIEVVSRNTGKNSDGNTEVEHIHKIKVWDKNSALEKIAKHLGMFIDKVEHSGNVNVAFETIYEQRPAKV